VAKIVDDVTKGLTDPTEKARAPDDVAAQEHSLRLVRRVHGYTPHLPSQVCANRFGDCKDGSQLLAVMMRRAGIKAELVTINTLDHGQILPDVPSIAGKPRHFCW